jgi:hypothetical protein
MPSLSKDGSFVPGKWWVRFSHGVAGTSHFTCENEPVLTFFENGTCSIEADENFIVFPTQGFQIYWKVYHPAEGIPYQPIYPEELRRLDAESTGEDAVGRSGEGESSPSRTTESKAVGRNRKAVSG